MALLIGSMTLGPVLVIGFVENQWSAPEQPFRSGQTRRLVHWNVHGGRWGWSGVRQTLQELAADAVILSEAPGGRPLSSELGAGYQYLQRGNLAILVRGSLAEDPRELRLDHGVAWLVRWQDMTMLVVDLPSNLLVKRDPLLKQIRLHIVDCQPDIVVGDFNAPRRSLELSHLPSGYAHAYDQAGSGWSCTWPAPLPLWAIDQCILGSRIDALHYELRSTLASDHCLQVLDFYTF